MSVARDTREVRAGEELDAERLRTYLAARLGGTVGPLTITQFPGGLFKTAVVAQQIYYRFKQGLTKDLRFARLIEGVKTLLAHAVSCSESGDLGS